MKKLYPDNPYEYVVYHDDFLLELGRKLWYDFSINNELEVSQTSNASRQIVRNALPDEETKDSILNYLGIEYYNAINEFKVEAYLPCKEFEDAHLHTSRWEDIIPTETKTYQEGWPTSSWHTDWGFPLNNYKLIVYLNDVLEGEGGTQIAYPFIFPKKIGERTQLFEDGTKIKPEDITYKEIYGPAGTCMCMSSHMLHRAAFPKSGYRLAMHISFELPDDIHYYPEYRVKPKVNNTLI